jgi:predicted RNA-binding Zn-ribbon protein involved in translation (DUF1610 family)
MAETLHARPMAEPETRIDLQCPACGYLWDVATVLSGVWWGKGVTPAAIAELCWCPHCHERPPMKPAPPPPLPVMKWPYCVNCGHHITLREAASGAHCAECRVELLGA